MNEVANSKPILSVRDLVTHFKVHEGVVKALEGVSFDVFPGRTLGIVGESGCGKSVTARSILRILDDAARIVSGQILLDQGPGKAPVDLAKAEPYGRTMRETRGGRISLVFQEPMTSLSAHYTVGNQIGEVLKLHAGMNNRQARARAIELLAEVGIPAPQRRVDEYPFQLSGGLRQRVMIAMALAGDPDILIADEPTTALDVTTQAQILELLRHLMQQRGLALILITHNIGVIAEMADDVAVMYLGRVVEFGSVYDIFELPRHPYTIELLRSVPSIAAKPGTRLATISGSIPNPLHRPTGCPFHPRCPAALPDLCDRVIPPEILTVNGSRVSCVRVEAGS